MDRQREDLRPDDHCEPVRDLLEAGRAKEGVDDVGVHEGQVIAEKDDGTSSSDRHVTWVDQPGARLEHHAVDRSRDPAGHEIGGVVPPVPSRARDPRDRSLQGLLREVLELGGEELEQPVLVPSAPLGDHSRDLSNGLAALLARVRTLSHRSRNIGQMPARSRRRSTRGEFESGRNAPDRASGLWRSRTAGL